MSAAAAACRSRWSAPSRPTPWTQSFWTRSRPMTGKQHAGWPMLVGHWHRAGSSSPQHSLLPWSSRKIDKTWTARPHGPHLGSISIANGRLSSQAGEKARICAARARCYRPRMKRAARPISTIAWHEAARRPHRTWPPRQQGLRPDCERCRCPGIEEPGAGADSLPTKPMASPCSAPAQDRCSH